MVSSALIGCIIGGLIGGWVSTNIGRKRGLVIAAVLFLLSALGAAAPEFPFAPIGHGGPGYMGIFVFYRILGGIGVGLASMLSPMYIAEIAPPKVRGNLVAWNQFAIIFGMLVIYFVNFGISKDGQRRCLAQYHRLALHVPLRHHSRGPFSDAPVACA